MSVLPFSNPFSSRAVLFMTDEGVSLHSVRAGKVTYIGSEPWKGDAFEARLANMLVQVKGASITVLNDAVEQHYRKERVVVMTMLDKKNMVQRRLNVAFPNYAMRAAMPLKSDVDKSVKQENVKGEPYLFAAVPSTETYAKLVKGLAQSEAGIGGYGLLPVESVGLVKALSNKLAQRWGGTSGAMWSILISQHHGGGLRQIVIRGNELALTRVTPVEEPNPEQKEIWAGDVSQELQATFSYLSRFGYAPEDGINVMVVGNVEFTGILEELISVPCNFEAISPGEAAKLLGFKVVELHDSQARVDGHFAESLHAGWVAKKLSLTLPLTSRDLSAISNPRRTASIALMVLNAGFAVGLYMASQEALEIYKISRNFEVAEQQKSEIERLYQEEVKRKERMGIDVNLIKGSLEIHDILLARRVDFLGLINDVSRSLETLRLDGFEFKNDGNALVPTPANGTPVSPDAQVRNMSLVLKVSFAGNINPADGNRDMDNLKDRISRRIQSKGYTIEVTKPVKDLGFTGAVEEEVGLTANSRQASDRYNAEITIKKVVK